MKRILIFTLCLPPFDYIKSIEAITLTLVISCLKCKPCIKMDRRVLTYPKFREYVKPQLVTFLIDIEKEIMLNIFYELFKEEYEINTLAAMVITDQEDSKMKEIERKLYNLEDVMRQLKN